VSRIVDGCLRKNILLLGSYISLWRQLCLFTFFIIQHEDYDTFNILIDQFKTTVENEKSPFTRDDFNAFFAECSSCMRIVRMNSPNKHITLKDLLRLIGLLNISRNNFSLNSPPTKEFTTSIFYYITQHLTNVMALVTPDEWSLFKNGLATIICIHLLFEASVSSKLNKKNHTTLEFLERISNRHRVEEIANTVLEHVDNLSQPISGLHWIELLTFVSPDRIRLNHLEFNRSFGSYLTCIEKFSIGLSLDKNFKENVARHFDDLILKNHFQGMFI
jgi:hypothetical protein